MKKVISLFLVLAMMIAMFTVSFSASFSVSDLDDEGNPFIWSAKDAIAAYEQEYGEEVETSRIFFQMPDGNRGATATEDHSVTITDYAPMIDPETGEPVTQPVIDPETGEPTIDPETGEPVTEPVMEAVGSHDEVVIHAGEKAPNWYSDNAVLNGQNYAACYWWGGTADSKTFALADGTMVGKDWCGYRAEIDDYDQGIYYIDLPNDVATAVWNNGVNGGMDSTKPIYYEAAQTGNLNMQGAYEGDYDSLPYGSPNPEYFDQCIYVIDPDSVDVNPLTNKQVCGGVWYVYYGDGCYGQEFAQGLGDAEYPDGTPDWSDDRANVCLNPDHWTGGVGTSTHVGYQGGGAHVHTPAEPVKENMVAASYNHAGSYDSVVYCSDPECGAEISRETVAIPKIELESNKLYFDATTTPWNATTKNDRVAFNIFGGDFGTDANPTVTLSWSHKKLQVTAITDSEGNNTGLFGFAPSARNYTLNPGVQYKIVFNHTLSYTGKEQTYDLLFTADCLGHVAYADGTEYENPVDSSKKTLAAFWDGLDASVYGPVLQVSSIGNVVGTCPESGKTPMSIFSDFATVPSADFQGKTALENARYYTVEQAKTKTEQEMIDDIGSDLGLTKQDVYDVLITGGVETVWDYTVSDLPGDVVIPTEAPTEPEPTEAPPTEAPPTEAPHVHTPGEPVQENIVPASCTQTGSYDEVVYCTECGEELSREQKTIAMTAHQLKRVNGKAPTATQDGWISHYKCTVCGKYFSDASGNKEVTWEQIVKPATGTPTTAPVTEAPATEPPTEAPKPTEAPTEAPKPTEPPVTGLLGDIDDSGEVDIIDVTWIQRCDIGIKQPDAAWIARGDVNKSKTLTVIDATIVQRWLVGLNQDMGIGEAI